jgi:hypothetical protein
MPQGMPTRQLDNNICAVCGNKLLVGVGEEGVIGVNEYYQVVAKVFVFLGVVLKIE